MTHTKRVSSFFLAFFVWVLPSLSGASIEVKLQTDPNFPVLEKICIRGYEESYKSIALEILKADSLEAYAKRIFSALIVRPLEDQRDAAFLLTASDTETHQVLGFAHFMREGPEGSHAYYLKLIVVDPTHQRRGIGKLLLFGIREIDPLTHTLRFDARKLNTRAVTWYRRLGFQDDPTAIDDAATADDFLGFRIEFPPRTEFLPPPPET